MRVQQVGQTWRTSARDDGSAAFSWLDMLGCQFASEPPAPHCREVERHSGQEATSFLAVGAFGKSIPGQVTAIISLAAPSGLAKNVHRPRSRRL